ncbi:MAG: hypothetical protein RI967_281 [Planctomycetota bacterium]
MKEPSHTSSALATEFESVFSELRGAMRQALLLHVKPTLGARAAARTLGLDKSIGWKVHQLAFSEETGAPSTLIPGARGWAKVTDALRARGTPNPVLELLERAIRRFEAFIVEHRLARTSLDSLVSGSDATAADARHLVRLRKEAADALAAVLGMRIRARIGAYVVAPTPDGDRASLAGLTMMYGPERHVAGSPWPLYSRLFSWQHDEKGERIGTGIASHDPLDPLVRDLSSPLIGDDELCPSPPVGRPGIDFLGRRADRREPLLLSFAEHLLAAGPLYTGATEEGKEDETVDFGLPISNVMDLAVFDIFVHRAIPRGGDIACVLARRGVREQGNTAELRCEATLERPSHIDLPGELLPLAPAYRELVARGAAAVGAELADLEHHRFALPYPPISSRIVFSWRLPRRPNA